jgi:hypothetical protein
MIAGGKGISRQLSLVPLNVANFRVAERYARNRQAPPKGLPRVVVTPALSRAGQHKPRTNRALEPREGCMLWGGSELKRKLGMNRTLQIELSPSCVTACIDNE